VSIRWTGCASKLVAPTRIRAAIGRTVPACQAPDGSTLLCLITDQYTRPRDLIAAALSLVIGLVATVGIFLRTTHRRSTARRPSRAPMR
jgi:hypothetical protein